MDQFKLLRRDVVVIERMKLKAIGINKYQT